MKKTVHSQAHLLSSVSNLDAFLSLLKWGCTSNVTLQTRAAVNLHEPHLSAVSKTLQRFGIDPSILNKEDNVGKLHLRRTFSTADSGRLKSVCRINDKHISLKTLRQIAAPLFTRVDVGVASSALGIPASRLTILDMGVPEVLKRECIETREKYKGARGHTERIKRDLQSRVLPSSLQRSSENEGLDEEQLELMKHWVDELGELY